MLQASGNPFVVDRGSSFIDQTWAAGWGVINTLPHQFSPSHSPSRCFLSYTCWPVSGDYQRNKKSVSDLLVHEVCRIVYVVPEGLKSREMQHAYRVYVFVSYQGMGITGAGKFVLIAVRRRRDGAFLTAGDRQEVSIAPKLCLNFCSRKPRRKFMEYVPCTPPHKA